MIKIMRSGRLVCINFYENDQIVKTFTCDRITNKQAKELCVKLHQLRNDNHGFVAMRNMMEFGQI